MPTNTGDSSQYMYHVQKQDTDVEYLDMVRMALHSHEGSINIADAANIREVHKEVLS